MGRRGPAPKPTNLKLIQGNPGKRAINKDEPRPTPIAPRCPTWLDPEAKREWKRVAPELEKLGLLTAVDGTALMAYCQACARLTHAERAIKDYVKENKKLTMTYINNGGGANEVPIPEIRIAREAALLVKTFCVEFGLTPSARGRMLLPGSKGEEDPFEEFLSRGKKKA